jgi:hypothetical protein
MHNCMATLCVKDKTLCIENTQQDCSQIRDTSMNVCRVLSIIYNPVTRYRNVQSSASCFCSTYMQCATVVQPDASVYFKHSPHVKNSHNLLAAHMLKQILTELFVLYFYNGLPLLTSVNTNLSIPFSLYFSS